MYTKTPGGVLEHLVGGMKDAGPRRLESAGEKGIPQVVAPGAVDFYSWAGTLDTLPEDFRERRRHQHNELAWAVERSLDEVALTAELIAARLNKSRGPRAIVIPELGFSEWDKPGGLFYHPERSRVFNRALKAHLNPEVELIELEMHINDPAFAGEVAGLFKSLIGSGARG
ncbi:MAG: Tm-1-like ATP-binding domain-containing protein [Dehalococcoidia bacterium]|nr:Tm-1-like ATP-binding domain-containing protein [Dehalococcoidia bacterium]